MLHLLHYDPHEFFLHAIFLLNQFKHVFDFANKTAVEQVLLIFWAKDFYKVGPISTGACVRAGRQRFFGCISKHRLHVSEPPRRFFIDAETARQTQTQWIFDVISLSWLLVLSETINNSIFDSRFKKKLLSINAGSNGHVSFTVSWVINTCSTQAVIISGVGTKTGNKTSRTVW